jgi:hypothetical protein
MHKVGNTGGKQFSPAKICEKINSKHSALKIILVFFPYLMNYLALAAKTIAE